MPTNNNHNNGNRWNCVPIHIHTRPMTTATSNMCSSIFQGTTQKDARTCDGSHLTVWSEITEHWKHEKKFFQLVSCVVKNTSRFCDMYNWPMGITNSSEPPRRWMVTETVGSSPEWTRQPKSGGYPNVNKKNQSLYFVIIYSVMCCNPFIFFNLLKQKRSRYLPVFATMQFKILTLSFCIL